MGDTFDNREVIDPQEALDERFARFGLRPLSDADVWALGMATMVMPDGNPGAEAYLTQVAGIDAFAPRLTVWGRVVAIGIAQGHYKARDGRYRRAYVEGYDATWGRFAVADGLTLALYGYADQGIGERCRTLGCGKQGYQRIRDFVGGALVSAIAEFRVALEWATGSRRDRVLTGRWEGITGQKWDDARADANMGQPSSGLMFAPGCARTVPLKDMADAYEDQPETLYHGLRPTGWWSDGQARLTRQECPAREIYPGHGTYPRC